MEQLSLLELSRRDDPRATDREHITRLAVNIVDELDLKPPIDPQVVASFQGVARIEEATTPWAGCLVPEDGKLVIKVRASDNRRRQRFSALHEVGHTFLPGFNLQVQYRCDTDRASARDPDEVLCDAAASELLFPRRYFTLEMGGLNFGIMAVQELADKYDASLEATARRYVDLWPEPAMLVVLEKAIKPIERQRPQAEPKLRVQYAYAVGRWPFVPRHKSVREGSVLSRVLDQRRVEGDSDLDGLSEKPEHAVEVSALSCPFPDRQGTIHERVLVLYRMSGQTHARPKG